ncbi:MAG: hypothetical protein VXY99_05805 [Pseudomonadota bacterium]|nr:hypothetical protein [Pseudomonadota bacterium]MEC8483314.1 hypothetical protein [Pseudomonadota bacterium]
METLEDHFIGQFGLPAFKALCDSISEDDEDATSSETEDENQNV